MVLVNQLAFIIITRTGHLSQRHGERSCRCGWNRASRRTRRPTWFHPSALRDHVSIVTALLPRLSSSATEVDWGDAAAGVSNGARLIAALIVPCAAMLVARQHDHYRVSASVPAAGAATYPASSSPDSPLACCHSPSSTSFSAAGTSVEDTVRPFPVTVIFNVVMLAITIPLYAAVPPG